MDRLKELIDVLSDEKVEERTFRSRQAHTCKICQKPAVTFTSEFSECEYRLSAICEDCQKYFDIGFN